MTSGNLGLVPHSEHGGRLPFLNHAVVVPLRLVKLISSFTPAAVLGASRQRETGVWHEARFPSKEKDNPG